MGKDVQNLFILLICIASTVESRFLEPPGETQFGSRNREFEKSKVASNYAKLAGYCLIMSKCSSFNKNTSFLM